MKFMNSNCGLQQFQCNDPHSYHRYLSSSEEKVVYIKLLAFLDSTFVHVKTKTNYLHFWATVEAYKQSLR